MALTRVMIGKGNILYAFIAFAVIAVAFTCSSTRSSAAAFTLWGGNEQSAVLWGFRWPEPKSQFAISSFCAALAGVVFSFHTLAGYSLQNMGLELDSIRRNRRHADRRSGQYYRNRHRRADPGIIQTIVIYQNLNTWWTKVTIAALLCIFIVIQRIISIRAEKGEGRF